MFRKYLIPVFAAVGLAFAAYTVHSESRDKPIAPPVAQPGRSPYTDHVAGAGIIEASTQNIAIGTNLAGIVAEVFVIAGDRVKAGDPLFRLDDRALKADLGVRRASLAVAEQTLQRLGALPRPEDIPAAQARVAEAEASLADATSQLTMWDSVPDKRAVSQDELNKRRYAVQGGQARLDQAKASLALLIAGSWKADIEVARAQVAGEQAQVQSVLTDLDRLVVRAPVEGQVLQLNVRVGEFAPTGVMAVPLILLGGTDTMHVRVDVDENDAWRISPGARARATLRGNAAMGADLTFIRIEPYVIPKRSLTGESTERVDTRVLQIIYAFPHSALNAYVGQLVDVNIEAPPAGAASDSPGAGDHPLLPTGGNS